jgi:2-polyprenyl-6-methoxyphenol hydroxylase-like FAD-dependent oxidoreductase
MPGFGATAMVSTNWGAVVRVIVVGSGIAGLSAAIALRAVGVGVVVYERAPELREVGAGISLWANAIRALDYLGAGDAVRARALRLVRSEMRCDEGRRVQVAFPGEVFEKKVGVSPFVAMIHRAELVDALAGFLPAGVGRYGYECVGVEQAGDRVAVRFANGRADEADAVVGADGIRSAVRTSLFGPQEPRYAGYTCWRGISPRPATVPEGYIGEWWGRGKRFGITTLTQDRVYWFAVHNAPPGRHSADEKAVVADLFRGWADPVPELVATTPPDRLVHNDIIDRPPTKVWSRGRVGLVGDAAHPTTPNFGQGGCLAIEDAVVLARAFATHADPARAFEAFTAERYRRTAGIVNESWRFGKVSQWEGRLSCWFRDRVLGLLLPAFGAHTFPKHASFDVGPLR